MCLLKFKCCQILRFDFLGKSRWWLKFLAPVPILWLEFEFSPFRRWKHGYFLGNLEANCTWFPWKRKLDEVGSCLFLHQVKPNFKNFSDALIIKKDNNVKARRKVSEWRIFICLGLLFSAWEIGYYSLAVQLVLLLHLTSDIKVFCSLLVGCWRISSNSLRNCYII